MKEPETNKQEEKHIDKEKSKAISRRITAFFFLLALLLFVIAFVVYRFR